jgi:uncharacterized membrane protein YhaH (DUF805 family)
MSILSFNGRATRLEWWATTVVLMFTGVGVFAVSVGGAIAKAFGASTIPSLVLWTAMAVFLLSFYIGITTSVRRYHDRGKSGWWVLVGLIPVVGAVWQLVELGFFSGTPGDNAYGLAKIEPASAAQSAVVVPPFSSETAQQPEPVVEEQAPIASPAVEIPSFSPVAEPVPAVPAATPESAVITPEPVPAPQPKTAPVQQ